MEENKNNNKDNINRCDWVFQDTTYIDYHDNVWGNPQRDRINLFEMLSLGVCQCGISWNVVFKKREHFKIAFNQFDIEVISKYTELDLERLMKNENLIRNRNKLSAIINNAKKVLELEKSLPSGKTFSDYLWSFVNDKPIVNNLVDKSMRPTRSDESDKMAAGLKSHGFKFVGTTICYAFMQTCGLVNDHLTCCWTRSKSSLITSNSDNNTNILVVDDTSTTTTTSTTSTISTTTTSKKNTINTNIKNTKKEKQKNLTSPKRVKNK